MRYLDKKCSGNHLPRSSSCFSSSRPCVPSQCPYWSILQELNFWLQWSASPSRRRNSAEGKATRLIFFPPLLFTSSAATLALSCLKKKKSLYQKWTFYLAQTQKGETFPQALSPSFTTNDNCLSFNKTETQRKSGAVWRNEHCSRTGNVFPILDLDIKKSRQFHWFYFQKSSPKHYLWPGFQSPDTLF